MEFRRVLFRSPDDRPRRAGFSGERRERPTGDQRRRFQNHRTSVGGGWAAGKRRRLRRIASIGCAVTGARNRHEISGGCHRIRSEEHSAGKEDDVACRTRWSPYHEKKNKGIKW